MFGGKKDLQNLIDQYKSLDNAKITAKSSSHGKAKSTFHSHGNKITSGGMPKSSSRDKISPAFDVLLKIDSDFLPIAKPGPDDWLSQHEEEGQSFDQYVASRPNMVDNNRNIIYILPLGEFSNPSTEILRDYAQRFFQIEARVLPVYKLHANAFSPRTNPYTHNLQIRTTEINDFLITKLPSDAYCLIAVTMVDLYPDPKWNFVFGQARLKSRVGVFSFARHSWDLDDDDDNDDTYNPKGKFAVSVRTSGDECDAVGSMNKRSQKILLRACKVLTHETGHMFGMSHDISYHCLMNGSNHAEESDRKPTYLCAVCLRKLAHSLSNRPFDLVKRYVELRDFYTVYARIGGSGGGEYGSGGSGSGGSWSSAGEGDGSNSTVTAEWDEARLWVERQLAKVKEML